MLVADAVGGLILATVAVGFVVVWRGFGATGYGPDAHPHRVLWACIQLSGFALVLVCIRGRLPLRLLLALAFFVSAGYVWGGVRTSGATGNELLHSSRMSTVKARSYP